MCRSNCQMSIFTQTGPTILFQYIKTESYFYYFIKYEILFSPGKCHQKTTTISSCKRTLKSKQVPNSLLKLSLTHVILIAETRHPVNELRFHRIRVYISSGMERNSGTFLS